MRKSVLLILALLIQQVGFSAWAANAEELQPIPVPLSNNAVAGVRIEKQFLVYSFMGLGAKKSWNAFTNAAYAFNVKYNTWTAIKPAPGIGRLGAVAVAAREQVFVIGGYVPDPNGMQSVVRTVSIYEPAALRWHEGTDLPSAVRDAVAGVYRDRYIYVIGGFTPSGLTNQVQVYDLETKQWSQATPSPGTPVLGHAGSLVNDTIIYIDGARAGTQAEGGKYLPSDECWMGKIDHHDPKKITWSKLPAHPGAARYRIAAGGSEKDQRVYFAGGSDGIYDFNGIGMDGKPAEPSPTVFAYNLKSNAWETIDDMPNPTMDHHGLAVQSDGLILVGGMGKGQKVVGNTVMIPKAAAKK